MINLFPSSSYSYSLCQEYADYHSKAMRISWQQETVWGYFITLLHGGGAVLNRIPLLKYLVSKIEWLVAPWFLARFKIDNLQREVDTIKERIRGIRDPENMTKSTLKKESPFLYLPGLLSSKESLL